MLSQVTAAQNFLCYSFTYSQVPHFQNILFSFRRRCSQSWAAPQLGLESNGHLPLQDLAAAEKAEAAGTSESLEGQAEGGQRLGLDAATAITGLQHMLGWITLESR